VLLVLVPIVPPLLAAGMPSSDYRACGGIPHRAANDGSPCRAFSPISRTLAALLLLALLLLLGLRLLLSLCLLLRLRCRWCLP
jgi:hypothetical protein